MSVLNTIFGSIAVNGIVVHAFIIVLLCPVGDIDAIRDSPYLIWQIYAQATGPKVGGRFDLQVFFSWTSLALTAGYVLPIGCMLRARLKKEVQFGDWRLGRLSVPINILPLLYSVWMNIVVCFPTYLPVAGDDFNSTLPIFAFVVMYTLAPVGEEVLARSEERTR